MSEILIGLLMVSFAIAFVCSYLEDGSTETFMQVIKFGLGIYALITAFVFGGGLIVYGVLKLGGGVW